MVDDEEMEMEKFRGERGSAEDDAANAGLSIQRRYGYTTTDETWIVSLGYRS